MKNHLTALISASALRHNLRLLRELAGPAVKLCPVVKDNCYGHGLDLLIPLMMGQVDGFCMAAPPEALHLRELGYRGFVLCLLSAWLESDELIDELILRDITQTIIAPEEIGRIAAAAKRVGRPAHVHLKVDTGMGRLGVPCDQVPEMIGAIAAAGAIELTGIYTHFAAADEADKSTAIQQLQQFRKALPESRSLVRHAANSAALIDLPEARFDMVRPGIALYGCQPADTLCHRADLRPIMSLRGRLMTVKTLPKGSRSGYGLTHAYSRDSRVGVIPIGYGDGYFRSLSDKAVVRIGNRPAPVCGRVSMDQITVDLTDIPDARAGDEVEIIAADPHAPNSVEGLARLAGTIPYEITCRLGGSVRHALVD